MRRGGVARLPAGGGIPLPQPQPLPSTTIRLDRTLPKLESKPPNASCATSANLRMIIYEAPRKAEKSRPSTRKFSKYKNHKLLLV